MRKKREIDPRVKRTRSRVLSAAPRLLQVGGLTAVTYSALTRESGVGRATIYRHWPTLDTLWPDLVGEVGRAAATEPTGDLRVDLTSALMVMARNLGSRERRIEVITMLQRAQLEAEARRFVRAIERHNPVRQSLEHARHAGTLREDIDLDVAAALLSGPILQRALMAGVKADARFIDAIVDPFLCSKPQPSPGWPVSSPTSRARSGRASSRRDTRSPADQWCARACTDSPIPLTA